MNNEKLEILILEVMDKVKENKWLNTMKCQGHVDNRYFKKEYVWKITAAILLRILVNLAYLMGEKNFTDFFDQIRDKIIELADENNIDDFNDCHARK